MPIYQFECKHCNHIDEIMLPMDERSAVRCCPVCDDPMVRLISAPLGRVAGQLTPGGGPDRFTADMLGVPLKELPEGLKTK